MPEPSGNLVTPVGFDAGGFPRAHGQVFSYTEQHLESIVELNAAAGGNTLNSSIVPAGEIWVLSVVTSSDITSGGTTHYIGIVGATATVTLMYKSAAARFERVRLDGPLYLVPGDKLYVYIAGCTAGDDLYLDSHGYKMKL